MDRMDGVDMDRMDGVDMDHMDWVDMDHMDWVGVDMDRMDWVGVDMDHMDRMNDGTVGTRAGTRTMAGNVGRKIHCVGLNSAVVRTAVMVATVRIVATART